MSRFLRKSIQDISAAHTHLEGRSGRLRTMSKTRLCQEIADRGRSPQTIQGSNKVATVDARNWEGMIRMPPIAKLRWSAKCTRVYSSGQWVSFKCCLVLPA